MTLLAMYEIEESLSATTQLDGRRTD